MTTIRTGAVAVVIVTALLLGAGLAVAGERGAGHDQGQDETEPPIVDIVATQQAQVCIYARSVRSFEILNDEWVVLHGSHDRFWVNKLASRCVGLSRDMLVTIERFGSQICANDRFRAADRHFGVASGFGAHCRFGPFEPVAVEQVAVLKQAVKEG